MDRLQSMRVFCKVAQRGSFSKAAEELLMSAAVASRLVADLEEHLRVRLFNRTTRSVKLTEAGESYWLRCQHILEQIDEAESFAGGQEGRVSGRLRVLVGFTEGMQLLAPGLAKFQSDYPDLTIDLQLAERSVDLVSEGYDLAIQPEPFIHSTSVVARPLMQARMVLCAAPAYVARYGSPSAPGELSGHRCISFSHPALREDWPLHGPEGEVHVTPGNVMTSNNIEAILGSIRGGGGIGLAFEWLIRDEIDRGSLVRILPQYAGQELSYYVVYPSRKYLPAKVQVMVKYLREVFSQCQMALN